MKKYLLFLLFPLLTSAQGLQTNDTLRINCDSIYSKKGFSLLLIRYEYEELDGYFDEKNCVFIVQKNINGVNKEIYRDTIFSKVQEISFEEFNNDNTKDILIQNTSDVRSNWNYNLYLVNPNDFSIIKVNGFENIKNPSYNSKYDIVESYVSSGRQYNSFYKIIKNKIYDYDITIYDDQEENNNFNIAYEKAIEKILKKNKSLLGKNK